MAFDRSRAQSGKFGFTSEEIIRQVRKKTDTVLLAFSGGKDSIAAWLAIRPHFKRIIPIFRYTVPGLQFVEDGIRYYEKFFKTRIIRVPHPSLYRKLRYGVFQTVRSKKIIDSHQLPEPGYEEINDLVREDFGLGSEALIASGVRAFDSVTRYMHFKKHGAIDLKKLTFYPIFDWRKERLLAALDHAGVKLPPEYRLFSRSFDGLDLSYVYWVRKYYPEDFKRIKFWFPMVELEFYRYGQNGKEIEVQETRD
jgi:3'-phosphoadenosine 5'-phosphosulfate sulfotransferase (PAPS reductase)/FAD synthetase